MLLFPRLQLAEENAPKEQYYLLREQLLDVTGAFYVVGVRLLSQSVSLIDATLKSDNSDLRILNKSKTFLTVLKVISF